MTPELHPIAELTKEHQGRVTLLCIREFGDCRGGVGRPWLTSEKDGVCGSDDPQQLKLYFSHFMLNSEIKQATIENHLRLFGAPLTDSERQYFDEQYPEVK